MFPNRITLLFALTFAIILSACAPQAPQLSQQEIQQTIEIVVALTSLAQDAAQPQAPTVAAPTSVPPTASAPTSPPPTLAPTNPPPAPSVAVVFIPGGLFDAAKRAEFVARIIDPYIDYNNDVSYANPGLPTLVSITIETYDNPGYPYGANAVYDNGGYEGWLIAETGGVVDLWIPDCMGGPCALSPHFILNYPDIAATVQAP